MVKRLFWIGVGAGLGILAVSKAKAYLRANTPDLPRQFFLGADETDQGVAVRTLRQLYSEFESNRAAREAELNRTFSKHSAQ